MARAQDPPDLVIYVGEDYPPWQEGDTRKIDLNRWRVPDLVGEVREAALWFQKQIEQKTVGE